jgi:hypothetical protein
MLAVPLSQRTAEGGYRVFDLDQSNRALLTFAIR